MTDKKQYIFKYIKPDILLEYSHDYTKSYCKHLNNTIELLLKHVDILQEYDYKSEEKLISNNIVNNLVYKIIIYSKVLGIMYNVTLIL